MSHVLILFALTLIGADAPQPSSPPCPASCSADARSTRDECQANWRLTLPEAIRIGLDNCEAARIVEFSGKPDRPLVIAPVACAKPSAAKSWRFKAEVMALVGSIERQYWTLAQRHVERWASAKAVEFAEEILKREDSELEGGHGTVADVAEARQRLEQFRLDLVSRTSDLITAERSLRASLGLPSADDRAIIPVTPPVESRTEPDWDACLASMRKSHPEIAQCQTMARESKHDRTADDASAFARAFLPDLDPTILERADDPTPHARPSTPPKDLPRFVQQAPPALVRSFLELDASYHQFQTAARFQAEAARNLQAQRGFYEEGRIIADRYLGAVSRFTSAIALEAQFKARYNIALVAFEEARGTLLKSRSIALAEDQASREGPTRDNQTRTTSFQAPARPGADQK